MNRFHGRNTKYTLFTMLYKHNRVILKTSKVLCRREGGSSLIDKLLLVFGKPDEAGLIHYSRGGPTPVVYEVVIE